ncbi:MAG: hypothetical protein AB8B95_13740 [Pseudohongiellaceae bacterium]
MNNLKLTLALGLLVSSTTTLAQEQEDRHATLDTDGNGSVSFAEFQEAGGSRLARIDSDENGVLTLDEFLNARPGPRRGRRNPDRSQANDTNQGQVKPTRAERRERMTQQVTESFQEMDRDGDDVVSALEFHEANFLKMDKDNNGSLSVEELTPPRGRRGKGKRGEDSPSI